MVQGHSKFQTFPAILVSFFPANHRSAREIENSAWNPLEEVTPAHYLTVAIQMDTLAYYRHSFLSLLRLLPEELLATLAMEPP